MKHLPVGLLLAVLLGGCATVPVSSSDSPRELVGQTSYWVIKKVWDKDAIAGAPITLNFDGVDMVSGFSGCNQYAAKYKIAGRHLKISGVAATTAHACPADVMAQEKRLFDVLDMVHWVRSENNGAVMLRMLHEDGDPVQLTPARTY